MSLRFANLAGRAVLLVGDGMIDVERASGARFSPDPMAAFAVWDELADWAGELGATDVTTPFAATDLGPPVPRPSKVFGIGMNYRDHAAEAKLEIPSSPVVFTKFPNCISGPHADVVLSSDRVDWEVELVVVMGIRAQRVAVAAAWEHVAGLAIGQDVSERVVQWSGGGQFSLGKSFPTFGPIGPCLVTPDEVPNPDDLELGCSVDGDVVQKGRTSDMVFGVPRLIAELSAVLPLLPGDVFFTGTPAGIGATRKPPRFLQAGEVLETWVEGIGRIRNRLVAGEERP